MRWISRRRRPKNPEGWVVGSGDAKLGIVDLGSVVSGDVRRLIDRNLRGHGKPFSNGGVLNASCLPLAGAGSVVASSLAAGNVFLATANPATLMSIGGGVGSAVMGSGGIVAQAPFIAASTAILPVIAPVAIFMTVSSTMMSVQFRRLQSSLGSLTVAIHYLLERAVNEDYAQVLSAIARLQEIARECEGSRRFTDEAKIRLALVERDLSVARYRHALAIEEPGTRQDEGSADASAELRMHAMPAQKYLYALSSVAGVHVEGLRLQLAVLENSDGLADRVDALDESVRAFIRDADNLVREDELERYREGLHNSLEEMRWWQRNILQRELAKALADKAERAGAIRDNEMALVRDAITGWSEAMEARDERARKQSIVYYRDNNGEGEPQAYYTDELRLEPQKDGPQRRAG